MVTILLIDRDIPFIVSIKQALEGTGEFQVALAANPAAADEALRRSTFDIAVIDFDLQGMDIVEVIRLLRAIRPGLPLVLTPEDEMQAERAQFMDVQGTLIKPYAARDLIPVVRSTLRRLGTGTLSPPLSAQQDETTSPAPAATSEDFVTSENTDIDPFSAAFDAPFDLDEFDLDNLAMPDESAPLLDASESPDRARNDLLDELNMFEKFNETLILGEHPDDDLGAPDESLDWEPFDATDYIFGAHDEDRPETRLFDNDEGDSVLTTAPLDWAGPEDAHTDNEDLKRKLQGVVRKLEGLPEHEQDDPAAYNPFVTGDDDAPFDDVLDVVAQTPSTPRERSPQDQAFQELVDSMRQPSQETPRRTRLEELLAAVAPGSAPEAASGEPGDTLDYVLDAIQRGRGPREDTQSSDEDDSGDDTTIGDVIDGLFDPTFEGVLAALAGEDVDEAAIVEPTYEDDDTLDGEDDIPADFSFDSDFIVPRGTTAEGFEPPDTLSGVWDEPGEPSPYAPGETRVPGPVIVEPPITKEDSSKYPATTALSAVSSVSDGDFSLDDLLSQIEQQLPLPRERLPRLKPLPSWQRDGLLDGPTGLAAMFDRIEGRTPPAPPKVAPAPAASAPRRAAIPEPPVSDEDTSPSAARTARRDRAAVQEQSAPPEPPPIADLSDLLDSYEEEAEHDLTHTFADDFAIAAPEADAAESAPDSEFADMDLLSFDELVQVADASESAERAASVQIDPTEAEIEAAFYDAVDTFDDDATAWRSAPVDLSAELEDELPDYATDDVSGDLPEFEPEPLALDESDLAWFEEVGEFIAPDDDHLIELPVDEATQRIEAAIAEEDEQEDEVAIARIAVKLTQYSLESSAHATLLSRNAELVAYAGEADEDAIEGIFLKIHKAWANTAVESNSLIRFVTLPGAGEYLVYSTRLVNDLILNMAFHASTSVSTIRRQARRLSESLDLVPDTDDTVADHSDESPAEKTRPNRPTITALRPPVAAERDVPQRASRPVEEPYASYTALWMPHDPGLEISDDLAEAIREWVFAAAEANVWDVLDILVEPDYVALTLSAPQKLSPDNVIKALMSETATRIEEDFPGLSAARPLWADGYYVVTPPRALTDREIMRIMTVQRNAQMSR